MDQRGKEERGRVDKSVPGHKKEGGEETHEWRNNWMKRKIRRRKREVRAKGRKARRERTENKKVER